VYIELVCARTAAGSSHRAKNHNPGGWDAALHSGTPSIEGGCLFVGGSVVVWHVEQRTASEAALAAAFDGQQPQLLIGGGGISLDEGSIAIPSVIAERCTTRAAWFGSP
jgi:hypothetical protein